MVKVHGLNQIRVYSNASTYTKSFTNNRVWNLLECYTNRRWGLGYNHARFDLASFVAAAQWCDRAITFVRPDTNHVVSLDAQTIFDAILEGRPAGEVLRDICRAGRLGIPYMKNGKYKIVPLKREANLENAPVVRVERETRNVLRENGKPLFDISWESDKTLTNKLVLRFEDAEYLDVERPLVFQDEEQQFLCGVAYGDNSRKVAEKPMVAFGVRRLNEAIKLGWQLLNLGEFDSGGIKNNLRANFTMWFEDVENWEKYQVIKIESARIDELPLERRFNYFRIMKMRRKKDGSVDITAQAYPVEYYETLETETGASRDSTALEIGQQLPLPAGLQFGEITYANGEFTISVIDSP